MKVSEVISWFNQFAPFSYQENYDNSGLQVGDPQQEVTGALLTLDVTELVLDEAMKKGCNLVIAHHPVIFSSLKRMTGENYIQRIVRKAIKNDINILAVHTNLDNVAFGVNHIIADKLGLVNKRILSPKEGLLCKLYTYAPAEAADQVREALFIAGAGNIGHYSECSFNQEGTGTFRPDQDANPVIGNAGGHREHVEEVKIEVIVPRAVQPQVLKALRDSHPYEEIAYELITLENKYQEVGAGIVGELTQEMESLSFLNLLKTNMKTACIRHTELLDKPVKKVAVCGGSGSFLLSDAIKAGADFFVTADFKYHQFFDAEGRIVIADIGHYESEQFTVEIFDAILKKNNANFAVLLSTFVTNPINYF